jgi:type II secretory pathway component PulF
MAEPVTPLALATWARQFSTLINAGVSLMRSLAALQETAEEPLASITRDLSARVEAGAPLSQAMAAHPDVFNRMSLGLCRAGEVGGVLDETFAVWADWLERDMELRARLDLYYLLSQVGRWPVPREAYESSLRETMPDLDARVQEMTWCRMLGVMLGSGVPIIQSLQVATEQACPAESEALGARLEAAVRAGQSITGDLAQAGFSSITVQLVAVGEECGTLDRTLDRAARLLERELDLRLSAAVARRLEQEDANA